MKAKTFKVLLKVNHTHSKIYKAMLLTLYEDYYPLITQNNLSRKSILMIKF